MPVYDVNGVTLSDTPSTDAVQQEYAAEELTWEAMFEFARDMERHFNTADKERKAERALLYEAHRFLTAQAYTREEMEEFMGRLARVDLLVIDDLGNGSMTDTQSARLMEVVDSRYRACLPIWVTTQYGGNQFTEKAGAERATAILRRITTNALVLSDREPK